MANQSYPHRNLPESGYVSARTLAAALETSPSTIWRWSKSGRLPQPYRLSEGTTRWRVCEVRLALSQSVK
jgi:predicted DNA-binding transcriptional regulator AlpA